MDVGGQTATVYRTRTDGSNLERLGTFPTTVLSFSPDLTHVAYLDRSLGTAGAAGRSR